MKDSPQVKTAMTRTVFYVTPGDSLQDAARVMGTESIRHLPVVDEGRVVGVLSDRDVLLCSQTDENGNVLTPDMAVHVAMTRHPVTCREGTKISDVASMMVDRKIDCMPVTDGAGHLVGMITSSDLLELLTEPVYELAGKVIPFHFVVESYRNMPTTASSAAQ